MWLHCGVFQLEQIAVDEATVCSMRLYRCTCMRGFVQCVLSVRECECVCVCFMLPNKNELK